MRMNVKKYTMHEWSVADETNGNEPYAEIRKPDGEVQKIYGFLSSPGEYKIRYYLRKSGEYQYKIFGGGKSESGELYCEESKEHGMVRTNGTHFCYEDGTWFYPMGTTVYALIHQTDSLIEETMKTLEHAPFNKIRMCVFPKHFEYNQNEPPLFAFEKNADGNWDVEKPCFEFWNRLERRIAELARLGIQCDLILLHPYDRWGFADLTAEQVVLYLKYVVRRLASYPNIWWSLANEYDIMAYTEDDWKRFAQTVRETDPYGHLLSNHNMIIPWDFSNEATTHICLQIKNVDDVSRTIREFQKPLMVDECCYEGNIPYEWGNISAFELVNRFWKVYAQGGYASHGETFLDKDDILWWSKGGHLKGKSPERLRFLREIMESMPGPLCYTGYDMTREEVERVQENPPEEYKNSAFSNLKGKITWSQIKQMMLDGKIFSGAYKDEIYLLYYGNHCVGSGMIDLPEEKEYTIERIDVWEMTRETIAERSSGHLEFELPGKEGIAVLASFSN